MDTNLTHFFKADGDKLGYITQYSSEYTMGWSLKV